MITTASIYRSNNGRGRYVARIVRRTAQRVTLEYRRGKGRWQRATLSTEFFDGPICGWRKEKA